jgi:hypothetical protein
VQDRFEHVHVRPQLARGGAIVPARVTVDDVVLDGETMHQQGVAFDTTAGASDAPIAVRRFRCTMSVERFTNVDRTGSGWGAAHRSSGKTFVAE